MVGASENLCDLGFITRNPEVSEIVAYQGLRLIRVGGVDSRKLIEESYEHACVEKPVFHDAIRNYDQFANFIGKGASEEEIETIHQLVQTRRTSETAIGNS